MTLASWFHTFVTDEKVHIALILVAVDFVLGVAAALKTNTFALGYVAQLAKTDILEKLVPYFVVYAAALATTGSVVINGFTFGTLAGALFGLIVAAWVASILKSLTELGLKLPLPTAAKRTSPPASGADSR